ncbi:hypothetical protein BLNAU_6538 [Blattamonas nauphoetae]|uniref:Transcription factor TFIIIC triple barrel domain-containing protein n=1 Tax=Blattamonas nauphoetae TaxID=2049346 RepID=A0ABQ9Y464_9EUKA|nr:hypothetical protein BLNAU_6538 [Blattamonas nauphoetae]
MQVDPSEEGDEITYYCVAELNTADVEGVDDLIGDSTSFQLMGFDETIPILRIGGKGFIGNHDQTIGTHLIFSVEHQASQEEERPSSVSEIQYFGKATETVVFQPVALSAPPSSNDEQKPVH